MDNSFTTTIEVNASPADVYAAINNPRAWWSIEISGPTDQPGGVFDYHYRDVHRCKMRVTELVPGKRVVWHVEENYFSFTRDTTEWTGNDIVFDISPKDGMSELRFTHQGLTPEDECYDACHDGWTTYVTKSLRDLIVTGKGQPNQQEPETETERTLSA